MTTEANNEKSSGNYTPSFTGSGKQTSEVPVFSVLTNVLTDRMDGLEAKVNKIEGKLDVLLKASKNPKAATKKAKKIPIPGPNDPKGVTLAVMALLAEDPTLENSDLIDGLEKLYKYKAATKSQKATIQTTGNTIRKFIKVAKQKGWTPPKP